MLHKHLLVVDDEDLIREIVTLTLELTMGWQVTGASSGPEALKLAMARPPDAILLDVMMQDFDGPTTFRMLRSNVVTRDIPVIFLTAMVQSSDDQKFLQMGVQGIIVKPFAPRSLAHQVSKILRWERGGAKDAMQPSTPGITEYSIGSTTKDDSRTSPMLDGCS